MRGLSIGPGYASSAAVIAIVVWVARVAQNSGKSGMMDFTFWKASFSDLYQA